ncbi:unnamed protein product [Ectocarpus sp. 4 AP-2014]
MKFTMVLTLLAFGNTQAFFVSAPLSWRTAATAAMSTSSVCRAEDWAGFARRRSAGLCTATNSELDQSAEYVKAELARVQEEYEANRKAKVCTSIFMRREQVGKRVAVCGLGQLSATALVGTGGTCARSQPVLGD